MKTSLDYKEGFLCVLTESEISNGPRGAVTVTEWHRVRAAAEAAPAGAGPPAAPGKMALKKRSVSASASARRLESVTKNAGRRNSRVK